VDITKYNNKTTKMNSIEIILFFTVKPKSVNLKHVVVYYIYKSSVRTNDATHTQITLEGFQVTMKTNLILCY
jgi:hypothetical protein